VVERPRASSASAALSASARRVPSERMRDLGALAHDAALADLQHAAGSGAAATPTPVAARIAEGDRAGVVAAAVCDHVDQFRLVGGGHHHHVGQAPDRRCRSCRRGSRRRRRPARRGRWRSAPAGSGSPRHAPPDRRRAAGRSNRSRRTASSPRGQPAAKVTACCSAMPTSKVRSGMRLANLSSPVPEGMAAVMATILGRPFRVAFLDQRLGEHLGIARRAGGALACSPVTTSNF
jgi:hypothetical protein